MKAGHVASMLLDSMPPAHSVTPCGSALRCTRCPQCATCLAQAARTVAGAWKHDHPAVVLTPLSHTLVTLTRFNPHRSNRVRCEVISPIVHDML